MIFIQASGRCACKNAVEFVLMFDNLSFVTSIFVRFVLFFVFRFRFFFYFLCFIFLLL